MKGPDRRVLVAAAAMASVLAVLAVATPASTQSADAPWWPSDVGLSDFRKGWNLRVPVTIENGAPSPMPNGTPVQVHLDLGREAMDAGWPASPDGAFPSLFTLEPDSIQLVKYSSAWSQIEGPVPVSANRGWFEPDQSERYGRVSSSGFEPQRNPIVTLEWRIAEPVGAFENRNYMVYFKIRENCDEPPLDASSPTSCTSPPDGYGPSSPLRERLEGMYWMDSGEVLNGFHPAVDRPRNGQQPVLDIIGLEDDTRVRVLTYDGAPFPSPDRSRGSNPPNPFTIDQGQVRNWSFGPSETAFRIEASNPVLAINYDPLQETRGSPDFIPSVEGGLMGRTFHVPPYAERAYLIAPDLHPNRQDSKIDVDLTHLEDVTGCSNGIDPDFGSGDYACMVSIGGRMGTVEVVDDHPILVQYVPPTDHCHNYDLCNGNTAIRRGSVETQASSIYGSPTGSTFRTSTIGGTGQEPGVSTIGAGGFWFRSGSSESFAVDDPMGGRSYGTVKHQAYGYSRLPGTNVQVSGPAASADRHETWPLEIRTQSRSSDGGPLVNVFNGERSAPSSTDRNDQCDAVSSGPFGGDHGQSFLVATPFLIQPFYNGTNVEIEQPDQAEEVSLSQGRAYRVEPGQRVPTHVEADKPVSVTPLGDPCFYSRFLTAKPSFETPTVQALDYRGYLIGLEPVGGNTPLVEAKPGDTVKIPFAARNLGRWDGKPLSDTVHLEASTDPSSWPGTLQFESPKLQLASHDPVRTFLEVSVPSDTPSGKQIGVTVEATSQNNPNMAASFDAVVFSRRSFGVDAWFGPHSSSAGPDRRSSEFTPGDRRTFPLVVQNTGTGKDTFNLSIAGASGSWKPTLLHDGEPVDQIGPLAPGERRGLRLAVEAPESLDVADTVLTIDAASTQVPTATTRLQFHGTIALGKNVTVETDRQVRTVPPGGTTTFPVRVTNTGEDGVEMTFRLVGDTPAGWAVDFVDLGADNESVSLLPDQSVEAPIEIRAPGNATARTQASVLLQAEGGSKQSPVRRSVPLAAVAEEQHALDVSGPTESAVRPGGNVTIPLQVTNRGNLGEQVRVLPRSLPGPWRLDRPSPVMLAPFNGSATVPVTLHVPSQALADERPIEIVVTGGGARSQAVFQTAVAVAETSNLTWTAPDGFSVRPGAEIDTALLLQNQGNSRVGTRLDVDHPPGWNVTLSEATADIEPGTERRIGLRAQVPEDAEGRFDLRVTATTSESQIQEEVTVPVTVETPDLAVTEVLVPDLPESRGDVTFISVRMHNPSSVPAADVEIRLEVSGQTLDRTRFESIGPNRTVVAPLKWVNTTDPGEARIVWGFNRSDGFHQVGEETIHDLEPGTLRAEEVPGPGVSLVVVAAIVGIATASRIRRRRSG